MRRHANIGAVPVEPKRALWGVTVVLTLMWIGLVGGSAVGAQLVPAGSGLAGPAIALGYGAGASLVAGFIGFLLARRLSPIALRIAAVLTIAVSLVLVAFVVWRALTQHPGYDSDAPANARALRD